MEKASVAEYFRGVSVFITGGTGYVGRALLEKLLRSCPGLDKVYMLVRAKKGRDIEARLEHLFSSPVSILVI